MDVLEDFYKKFLKQFMVNFVNDCLGKSPMDFLDELPKFKKNKNIDGAPEGLPNGTPEGTSDGTSGKISSGSPRRNFQINSWRNFLRNC